MTMHSLILFSTVRFLILLIYFMFFNFYFTFKINLKNNVYFKGSWKGWSKKYKWSGLNYYWNKFVFSKQFKQWHDFWFLPCFHQRLAWRLFPGDKSLGLDFLLWSQVNWSLIFSVSSLEVWMISSIVEFFYFLCFNYFLFLNFSMINNLNLIYRL